jgi:UDP-N-acetyl-D-mannosaminuronic acid dehydrogenase
VGIAFASRGLQVTLFDIDSAKVEAVNAGRMPFREDGAEEMLRGVAGRQLTATRDERCLAEADAVVAVVGTPVDEHLNPTVKKLYRSIDATAAGMRRESLLVLRSTVYPGLTKLVHDRIRSRGFNLKLAFCPERIAEGQALTELFDLPQIVAAFTPAETQAARELFSLLTANIIELQPLEAELAKLFTNSWRYLNFAVSNQFYLLAQQCGLDFYRIHEAVVRDYPRMKSFARAGFAAGPCLLKDTLQLAAFSGNNFFLGHAAMLVNEGLPNFIVNQLRPCGLGQKTVAILGMAFKGDSDDPRESLSYKLKNLLLVEAGRVLCTDPYVPDADLVPLEEAVARAEIIVLGAPHSLYRGLKIPSGKRVVDVWGFWKIPTLASQLAAAESGEE